MAAAVGLPARPRRVPRLNGPERWDAHAAQQKDAYMTDDEWLLVQFMEWTGDDNVRAMLLQDYIAANGPLSEEAAEEVRSLLRRDK